MHEKSSTMYVMVSEVINYLKSREQKPIILDGCRRLVKFQTLAKIELICR